MGTVRNNMTIVHHYIYEEISRVRDNAVTYFEAIIKNYGIDYNVDESMVSPILKSPVIGEYSFVIMGDCANNGWDMSEDFAKYRRIWVEQQVHNVQNIVIVNFGENDPEAFCEEILKC